MITAIIAGICMFSAVYCIMIEETVLAGILSVVGIVLGLISRIPIENNEEDDGLEER